MSHDVQSHSALGRIVNELEETAIAVILGLMTLITFINVVLRYGFNTGIIWGLEAVTFLFAWLVLFGMSYAVKVTAHLGVDAVINLFSSTTRRLLALFAALIDQAWYETVDIPMPDWLRFIEPIMNEGETYGKLPRFIPYFMLPFGMALLLFRFIQAGARIFKGASTSLIVSHEAEDDIEAIKHLNAGN